MKYKFRRRLVYTALRLAGFFLFMLPVKIGVFLGRLLGDAAFILLTGYRRRTTENLKCAFGWQGRPAKKTAREAFENLGKTAAELINFPKINKDNIGRIIRAEGIEVIDNILRRNRGVVVVVPHMGNWELLAAWFALKGYPSWAIARPLRYEKYDMLINGLRQSKGLNIIPRGAPLKKIIGVLRANQIVGILPDQDIDSVDGVFVDFFKRPAYTPSGPVMLAMLSGAPVVPAICIRGAKGHRLIIERPIDLQDTGDRKKDIQANTQKWSDVFERYIRQYPSQWVWMHDRWKTEDTN